MSTGTRVQNSEASRSQQWEQAMSELYRSYLNYGKEALKDFDDEAVHQARVSSRKLITLLSILDPEDASSLRAVFKRSQKRLGKVRDADVLIQSFKKRRKEARLEGDKKTAKLLEAVILHQKERRKRQRGKLADELPGLLEGEPGGKWNEFVKERLPALVSDQDVNVAMRELEVAFEQQKKQCKELFKQENPASREALDELHKLRLLAKRIRYTASAASFSLDRKFHANETIYKDIQSELGEITDKRMWLEKLENIGRKELGASRNTWNSFLDKLQAELTDALRRNTVVDVPEAQSQTAAVQE
ncbi:CHAD domain-containing protein [Paenibacillus sp. URB8-2]|uniref:CHAD domain-containing protein n=1 Tax=Paenibacillus sp. URB8-2 TaxID=2741301 RepID=UPI0015BF5CD6|nr:CHAD domain-containing protein [Paenibacillus sp. URB8-2]BCG57123.1 hypothetical protein PUR_05480 [Paenibacillus sp. URB8-2]